MPRRRKNPLALKVRTETIHSIVALIFITLGALIILSFTGQGVILQAVNAFLIHYFGLSTLLLPFVAIAAGLVLFRTKWSWSQPHVLLGALFLLFGALGLFQTGSIGQQTFVNLGQLVTPMGAQVLFSATIAAGMLVMSQLSIAEVLEFIASKRPQKSPSQQEEDDAEVPEVKKKPLFSLSLPFGKKKGFDINTGQSVEGEDDEMPLAVAASADAPLDLKKLSSAPQAGIELKEGLTPNTANLIWEYPPLSLLEESEGGEADRGDVKKNALTIEGTLESF
ncbi:hypothetical protein KA078_01150, partial [Candidatus Woesebacteria bacterium]|nr:hypothetical protein [Candidatus Woesebacteria bacterium]